MPFTYNIILRRNDIQHLQHKLLHKFYDASYFTGMNQNNILHQYLCYILTYDNSLILKYFSFPCLYIVYWDVLNISEVYALCIILLNDIELCLYYNWPWCDSDWCVSDCHMNCHKTNRDNYNPLLWYLYSLFFTLWNGLNNKRVVVIVPYFLFLYYPIIMLYSHTNNTNWIIPVTYSEIYLLKIWVYHSYHSSKPPVVLTVSFTSVVSSNFYSLE